MRSQEEVDTVLALIARGSNDCEVSRETGIPRGTVKQWRRGRHCGRRRPFADSDHQCAGDHDFSDVPGAAYCYLLGMYLGDGWISAGHRGVWRLRVAMDEKYPQIIDECATAIEALMPGQRAYSRPYRTSRCVELSMSSKHWPCLFPQHGPGRKHHRRIELADWQMPLVAESPECLVRGLIHSDGCRVVANDRGVASVRYHFSNRSEDIKKIFCDTLDHLGVPWTRPCSRQIAVYRKVAVARLDEFVGPKN